MRVLMLTGLWLVATAAFADSADLRLQRYLDGLTTFEAQFRQQVTGANAKLLEEASGSFYLRRPGRLRWDYLRPTVQTIVADGVNLWLYDQDLEQVTVKPLGESLTATPALLLAGEGSAVETFAISEGKPRPVERPAEKKIQWLELLPKRADTDFTAIELGFVDEELRVMELKDKLGQTTRIEFSAVKRNAPLAASLFKFDPPAGADVIGKPVKTAP